jgi:hypothetical protein
MSINIFSDGYENNWFFFCNSIVYTFFCTSILLPASLRITLIVRRYISMLRRYVSTAFLTGSLLFGSLFLAPSPSTLLAKAVGEFVTITAIDGRTGMATLKTDGGEVFAVPKDSFWKVGLRMLCERVSDGTPHYLERCLVWQ